VLKRTKNILIITMLMVILLTLPYRASAIPDHVQALGKTIPVFTKSGKDDLPPMLVVGPAMLFKDRLPDSFNEMFHIYFVDIFIKQLVPASLDINQLTLDDFVEAIESIRQQLGLENVILFGHSSNGILALKYSEKYYEHVKCNILIGTTPFRGEAKKAFSKDFFENNADTQRKERRIQDKRKKPTSFVDKYNAKCTWNFFYYSAAENATIWEGIDLDEELVKKYFSLIDDFDIRTNIDILKVPTFLGLGLYDATCPLVLWTDEASMVLENPLLRYYIFDKSAHFPMIENSTTFIEQLQNFLNDLALQ